MADNDNKDTGSIDKMIKMMEMAKTLQEQSAQERAGLVSNSSFSNDNSHFDEQLQDGTLLSIKAAIPHMDVKFRRDMTVFVKLVEIQRALAYYETVPVSAQQPRDEAAWRKEMLKAMLPYCEGQRREKLENMMKIMDMSDIMRAMKEMQGYE